jgi:hypothetical protein
LRIHFAPDFSSDLRCRFHLGPKALHALARSPSRIALAANPPLTRVRSGSWPCKNAGALAAHRTVFLQMANDVGSVRQDHSNSFDPENTIPIYKRSFRVFTRPGTLLLASRIPSVVPPITVMPTIDRQNGASCQELTSAGYSITSSASASSMGGMSMPSAFNCGLTGSSSGNGYQTFGLLLRIIDHERPHEERLVVRTV